MNNYEEYEVNWTKEKVRRFWDYYAKNKKLREDFFTGKVGKEIINLVSKYIKPDGYNLDYGCGAGYLMSYLLKRGIQCQGLDFSQELLKRVEERFLGNKFYKGVILARNLPHTDIRDNFYDFIFFIETIEHLLPKELPKVLSELYRILKQGGYIFLTTPNNENLDKQKIICPDCGCIFHHMQHIHTFTKESLSELMISYNFNTVFCQAVFLGKDRSIYDKVKYLANSIHAKLSGKRPFVPHLIYLGKK